MMSREPTGDPAAERRDALRARIAGDVAAELRKQDDKWGADRNLDHSLWMLILVEEVGEAARGLLEVPLPAITHRGQDLRNEFVQISAVAQAILECGDRNGWWPT